MKKFVLLGWILFSSFAFSQPDTDFAYLGVHTSRLDQGLSHQLGLPRGAHLRVDRVAQGSPAENAGLKLYDILLKLDDQLLINPDQLKTLVQMRNPGERISLSVLRQSKPITVSVELLETPKELRDRQNRDWMDDRDPFDFDALFPKDRFRDFFRRHSFDFPDLMDFHRQPFFSRPELDDPSIAPNSPGHSGIDDPLHSGADVQTYSYSSSTQQVTVSDAEGSLQWTEKDGLRFLRATDLDGQVLFEGAITTNEDRKKMPEGVGQRLRAMQQAGQIPID